MRLVSGELTVEARADGRALLILRSATGEALAIERSPAQVAALRERLGEIAGPVAAPAAPVPDIDPPALPAQTEE